MPLLTVRCAGDPFAAIEIRDADHLAVATGTGEVAADAEPGSYGFFAAASGRQSFRRLDVREADAVVELQLGPYPSAAPTDGTSTDVGGHGAATQSLSERLVSTGAGGCAVGIILRRPAGASAGQLAGRRDGSWPVELAADGRRQDLAWSAPFASRSGDDCITAGSPVRPGTYIATIGDDSASSLVVPAWEGWQTLLFLPVTGDGIAASLAVVHVVPIEAPWTPTLALARLLDQLHWALIERPEVTDACLRALHRDTDAGVLASPLVQLLLGTLVAASSTGELARRQAGESLQVLSDQDLAGVVPSDVAALRLAVIGDAGATLAADPPVLARSADILIARESRNLQTIGGGVVDAMATRLASSLWFRWLPTAGRQLDLLRIDSYSDDEWREQLARAASAVSTVRSLEGVATASDPSTPSTRRLPPR
ncbi:MAG: hypothetical protein ACR2HP_10165 [Ilumatobacteraceae bacterium]